MTSVYCTVHQYDQQSRIDRVLLISLVRSEWSAILHGSTDTRQATKRASEKPSYTSEKCQLKLRTDTVHSIPMNQEAKASNSNCPQDRDKHLEHVLFNWKVLDHNKAFEQRCRNVVTFKIEFGHCIILEFLSRSFVGGGRILHQFPVFYFIQPSSCFSLFVHR